MHMSEMRSTSRSFHCGDLLCVGDLAGSDMASRVMEFAAGSTLDSQFYADSMYLFGVPVTYQGGVLLSSLVQKEGGRRHQDVLLYLRFTLKLSLLQETC